jgi:hypothetical protein
LNDAAREPNSSLDCTGTRALKSPPASCRTPALNDETCFVIRCEIGTMPIQARAMTSRPNERLRHDSRRISRSELSSGRAIPNTRPLGSFCVTSSQSPTRLAEPSAGTEAALLTPSEASVSRPRGTCV